MPVKARAGGQGRVRGGRVGAQQGAGGSPANPPAFDWFVDSVSGSDAANGTTTATAFQTLGAVATAIAAAPSKKRVALKRGSKFREALSVSGLQLSSYSTGALPIIDGSTVTTGWTVNGSQPLVWEKAMTLPTGGRPRVYENDTLMTWVADLATCASTPGSRVLLNDGGSVTVQIHPSDNGNPNTNGKTYEVTTVASGVNPGDSGSVTDIMTQRAINVSGSLFTGLDAVIANNIVADGSKHNGLVGSGSVIDSIFVRSDDTTPTEPGETFFVWFTDTATGLSASMTRCGWMADRGGRKFGSGPIAHDNHSGTYGAITAEQIWAVDVQTSIATTAVSNTIQGGFAKDCTNAFGMGANDGTLKYIQTFNSDKDPNDIGLGTIGATGTIRYQNCVFYDVGANSGIVSLTSALNGLSLIFTNCVFYSTLGRTTFVDQGSWTNGSLTVNNCIFASEVESFMVHIPTTVTYTADHNVYVVKEGGSDAMYGFLGGTQYSTLSSWKTATGQDANSICFAPSVIGTLFSGSTKAGDFRLAGSGPGAAATAISAGALQKWDWNAHASVSGAPTQWPKVPTTLAEAETYAENPSGWDFTAAYDTTPNAFSFTAVTGATTSTLYTSNEIVVSGINFPAVVTVTGGQYRVKPAGSSYGSYTSSPGFAGLGATLQVQQTSSGSPGSETDTVLTIGGVSATYAVTTAAATEGSELVTNGTFDSDLTGWSAEINAGFVTMTWQSPGEMRVSNTASAQAGVAYQTITTEAGATYHVKGSLKSTSGQPSHLIISKSDLSADYYAGSATSSAFDFDTTVVVTTTSTSVRLRVASNTTTAYGQWDNISMKKVL